MHNEKAAFILSCVYACPFYLYTMTFVTGVYGSSYTCKFSGDTIVRVGQISTTLYGGNDKEFTSALSNTTP
jgi:hypothetical protein